MAHQLDKKWRSKDVLQKEKVDFNFMFLSERILRGLKKAGFKVPSPIQAEALPVGLSGRDMLVQAKSGTGKTLVFTVIALHKLNRKVFRPQAIIVAPTREIAAQICSVVNTVGSSFHKLTCCNFIGGLPLQDDKDRASSTQIIVGTPGRLRQLIQLGSLPVNLVRLLVFDEADVLFYGPFKLEIDDIYNALPARKQVIATSATFPTALKKIIFQYLKEPHIACLNSKNPTLLAVVHYTGMVAHSLMPLLEYKNKLALLEKILTSLKFAQCLVFVNLVGRVETLCRDIKKWGFSTTYICSSKEQSERLKTMDKLKQFKCKILVSSDVTSRGIDAENVDLVINFDLALSTETYLHRVGRAGRYGSIGLAVSIITERQIYYLRKIEDEGHFKCYQLPDELPKDLIKNPIFGKYTIPMPVDSTTNGVTNKCDGDENMSEIKECDENELKANENPIDIVETPHSPLNEKSKIEIIDSEVNSENIKLNDLPENSQLKLSENGLEANVLPAYISEALQSSNEKLNIESIGGDTDNCKNESNDSQENSQLKLSRTSENEEIGFISCHIVNGESNDAKTNNTDILDIGRNQVVFNEKLNYSSDEIKGSGSDSLSYYSTEEILFGENDKAAQDTSNKESIIPDVIESSVFSLENKNTPDLQESNYEMIDEDLYSIENNRIANVTENKKFVEEKIEHCDNSKNFLRSDIKKFMEKYEKSSLDNVNIVSSNEFEIDDSEGRAISAVMIRNFQNKKHDFFYQVFKTFENKNGETLEKVALVENNSPLKEIENIKSTEVQDSLSKTEEENLIKNQEDIFSDNLEIVVNPTEQYSFDEKESVEVSSKTLDLRKNKTPIFGYDSFSSSLSSSSCSETSDKEEQPQIEKPNYQSTPGLKDNRFKRKRSSDESSSSPDNSESESDAASSKSSSESLSKSSDDSSDSNSSSSSDSRASSKEVRFQEVVKKNKNAFNRVDSKNTHSLPQSNLEGTYNQFSSAGRRFLTENKNRVDVSYWSANHSERELQQMNHSHFSSNVLPHQFHVQSNNQQKSRRPEEPHCSRNYLQYFCNDQSKLPRQARRNNYPEFHESTPRCVNHQRQDSIKYVCPPLHQQKNHCPCCRYSCRSLNYPSPMIFPSSDIAYRQWRDIQECVRLFSNASTM